MTTIVDLLADERFQLPTALKIDPMDSFLTKWFNQYLEAVAGLDRDGQAESRLTEGLDQVRDVAESIAESVRLTLRGRPGDAFARFKGMMDRNFPSIERLITRDVSQSLNRLYRMRFSDTYLSDPADLFHIPFEKRHLVQTQRYSIPGMPAIYCGGTFLVCWIEMARRDLNRAYIARLEPAMPVRVIDLAYRPIVFSNLVKDVRLGPQDKEIEDFSVAYATLWPLQASCSLAKRNNTGAFHQEYIVPHMFMQWICDNDQVDGIRYFSMQVDKSTHDSIRRPSFFANYAFPSRSSPDLGHCGRLKSKFRITSPLFWQVLQASQHGAFLLDNGVEEISIARGVAINYLHTQFSNAEGVLAKFKAEHL